MHFFGRIITYLSGKLKIGGAVCLAGMSLLTCVDVAGRFFRHPIFGSVELVSFMGVMAAALALPFTHETRGHIGVELFVRTMPAKRRARIDVCTGIVSFIFFVLVAWRMAVYAFSLKASGEVSMNLELPEYLIVFAVAGCFLVLAGVILKGVIEGPGRSGNK
jgi:TRAP-type C4-dicarboxylate transport system permease small subunit